MMRSIGVVLVLALSCCGGPSSQSPPPEAPAAPPEATAPEPPTREPAVSHGAGPSCEEAGDSWLREHTPSNEELSEEDNLALKEQLNRGTYLAACQVTPSAAVAICAAIADGNVEGVTVTIDPGLPEEADCVAEKIRAMQFPQHPSLNVARTHFEPSL